MTPTKNTIYICTFVTPISIFSIVLHLQSVASWSFWLRLFLVESITILTWTRLLLAEIDRCGGAELVLLDFCSIFWFSTVFFALDLEHLSIVESSLLSTMSPDDSVCASFEIFLESHRSLIVLSSCKLSSIDVLVCAFLSSTQLSLISSIDSHGELFFSPLSSIVCFKKFFSFSIVARFFSELHLVSVADRIGSRKARLAQLWKLARFCLADEKSLIDGNDVSRWFELSEDCFFLMETSSTFEFFDVGLKINWN